MKCLLILLKRGKNKDIQDMNKKIKQKIFSIIIAILVCGIISLWIYWAFYWNNSKAELLLPPIEEFEGTNNTDSITVGTASGYRIDLSFEQEKINPYPYSISKGRVTIVNNNTNKIAPVDGTVTILLSNGIKIVHDIDDGYLRGVPAHKDYGMISGLESNPWYSDNKDYGGKLFIQDGMGEFEFMNIRRTHTYVDFVLGTSEVRLTDGSYTINSLNTSVENQDLSFRGNCIRTERLVPFGEYKDFKPPSHIESEVTTNFDYYYDITVKPTTIDRSINKELTVTITPKPLGRYKLPEDINNHIEMRVVPAYVTSEGSTYPAYITHAENSDEVLYFPEKRGQHPMTWEEVQQLEEQGKRQSEPSARATFFVPDEKPVTVTLEMTSEPVKTPFLGLVFSVKSVDYFYSNKPKPVQGGGPIPQTMTISKFVPIKTEPNRQIALWYLLMQASKILLGGVLISWLQYKYRKKTQSEIDKKPKI